MLSDSLEFLDNSIVDNMQVAWGSTLPAGVSGELFYLDTGTAGLYLHNGTDWKLLGESTVPPPEIILNNLYAWGRNSIGQLGDGTTTNSSTPKQVGTDSNWLTASGGVEYSVAIKEDGTMWSWGLNSTYYQLGLGDNTNRQYPTQMTGSTWKEVSCAATFAAALNTSGALYNWGYGPVFPHTTPFYIGGSFAKFDCGTNYIYGVKTDGTLWCIGNPPLGIGNGSPNSVETMTQVGSLTTWYDVSCGVQHTLAIKTDGTLWSWGYGTNGRLGNGATDKSTPTQVGTANDWAKVRTYGYGSYGIKTDGTLWAWGFNQYGELGLGDINARYGPVKVGALTNWKDIYSGNLGSPVAVKLDGTLWSWGVNIYGAFGSGSGAFNISSPVQVGSLTNWKKVFRVGEHVLALKG